MSPICSQIYLQPTTVKGPSSLIFGVNLANIYAEFYTESNKISFEY